MAAGETVRGAARIRACDASGALQAVRATDTDSTHPRTLTRDIIDDLV
jgi:hypothetical protein